MQVDRAAVAGRNHRGGRSWPRPPPSGCLGRPDPDRTAMGRAHRTRVATFGVGGKGALVWPRLRPRFRSRLGAGPRRIGFAFSPADPRWPDPGPVTPDQPGKPRLQPVFFVVYRFNYKLRRGPIKAPGRRGFRGFRGVGRRGSPKRGGKRPRNAAKKDGGGRGPFWGKTRGVFDGRRGPGRRFRVRGGPADRPGAGRCRPRFGFRRRTTDGIAPVRGDPGPPPRKRGGRRRNTELLGLGSVRLGWGWATVFSSDSADPDRAVASFGGRVGSGTPGS